MLIVISLLFLVGFYLVLYLSIVLHELAHYLTANLFHMKTDKFVVDGILHPEVWMDCRQNKKKINNMRVSLEGVNN